MASHGSIGALLESVAFTIRTWRGVPLLRALWWRYVVRWETEICVRCGRPVARWVVSWWHADDELWMRVVDDPNGVLCPRCFAEQAEARGVGMRWRAEFDD